MKKSRLVISLILIFFISASFNSPALAAGYRYSSEAVVLNELGLYAGVSTQYFDPDLGSQLQRQSAVILLVKMFGGKNAVDSMSADETNRILSDYVDNSLLASFARPYMAYAIKTGMVSGTSVSPKKLGATALIDSPSFACMILKNMGYSIDTRDKFLLSLNTLGALGGMNDADISALNNKTLIRDDVVGIIYLALRAVNADGETLINHLASIGAISLVKADELGFIRYDQATGLASVFLPEKPKTVSDRDIIYNIIHEALLNASKSVYLPLGNPYSGTPEKVFEILGDVVADDPRVLYYSASTYWDYNGLLELSYSKDAASTKKHMGLLDQKVSNIITQIIKPGMTDFDKELAIHDYIVNHCRYDLAGNPPPESYNAYGALCLGVAVCEGYSEAVQILAEKSGLECLVVRGDVINNGSRLGHAWNIVKIGGQYCHVDATWDDPVMADGSNSLLYSYFNLSDNEIKRDHAWETGSYPACVSMAYNYYVYNGLIAKGFDAFTSFSIDKLNRGIKSFTVKISDSADPGFDLQAALKYIMEEADMHSMTYRPVDKYGIIDLSFE